VNKTKRMNKIKKQKCELKRNTNREFQSAWQSEFYSELVNTDTGMMCMCVRNFGNSSFHLVRVVNLDNQIFHSDK
jgi:hypothetical protein